MDIENDDHTFEDKSATGELSASDKSHNKYVDEKYRKNSTDNDTDAAVVTLDDDEFSGDICKRSFDNLDKRNAKYKRHDEEKSTTSNRATSADYSSDWQTNEGRPSTKRQK